MQQYYKTIFKEVAEELGISESDVRKIYFDFYHFIVDKVKEFPFDNDNISEEDFKKIRTSFNVPSLGKFNASYKRYKNIKSKKRYYEENIKDKDGRV